MFWRAFLRRFGAVAVVALVVIGCGDEVTLRLLEPRDSDGSASGAAGAATSAGSAGGGTTGAAGAGGTPDGALIHRYDFEGSGTEVLDSVGTAHGTLEGGATLERGGVTLDGVNDHVALPGGLVSGLSSVTLLAWLIWDEVQTPPCWQRVFDFGNTTLDSSGDVAADTSLFLAPEACGTELLTASFEVGTAHRSVSAPEALPRAALSLAGVIVNTELGRLEVVLDGEVVAGRSIPHPLSALRDENAWLGRSQYEVDPFLKGRLEEFRIYAAALDASALAAIATAGPDAL